MLVLFIYRFNVEHFFICLNRRREAHVSTVDCVIEFRLICYRSNGFSEFSKVPVFNWMDGKENMPGKKRVIGKYAN